MDVASVVGESIRQAQHKWTFHLELTVIWTVDLLSISAVLGVVYRLSAVDCVYSEREQLSSLAESSMAERLHAGHSGLQIHGLAPSYLADELHHPAESEFRRCLCSALSHELSVSRTRLSTYGHRAFPVAAVRIWNSLPQHITSAPSLPVFCSRLKT